VLVEAQTITQEIVRKGPPLFKYETLGGGGEGCEIVLAHFCHFAQTAFVSDSLLSKHN
jgi:hypothetical protein